MNVRNKATFIAILLSSLAPAATLTVCASGCAYSNAQAAATASNPGDTILIEPYSVANFNAGPIVMPGGWHNVTIKSGKKDGSSTIDGYPRNYRITRGSQYLARLTQVTLGDNALFFTATPGQTTLTNDPNGIPTPHGLTVSQQIVASGVHYSAYACASSSQAPYGAACSGRSGYINIRTQTNFVNGTIIYLIGRSAPSPLALNTPYYVVNFSAGSAYPMNADQFQLAATSGGTPIVIPQFNPAGQDFIITVNPLPVFIWAPLYVLSTPSSTTLTVSLTPNGPPVTWQQMAFQGGAVGFPAFTVNPVHDITFDGVEIMPIMDVGTYYVFFIQANIGSFAGENYNINIWRSWVHGHPDQLDWPYAALNFAARDVDIGWSIFEDAYSTASDTQCIEIEATRDVIVHDTELKGCAENIMSGGNVPWFIFLTNTTGITVRHNYFWKPLSYFNGIVPTYVSPTQFDLLSRYGDADCSTVANDTLQPILSEQCFGYESQETPGTSTPPAASVILRDLWTATATNSTFTVTGSNSGQAGLLYWLGGVIHMDYSFSGAVSCPSVVTCTYVANPAFPSASSRIGIACMDYNLSYDCPATGAGGAFDSGTFFGENRNVFSKNLLESKYGDNWLVEGNVFHRGINIDSGATTQIMGINLTSGVTGSGMGEPVNYLATTSNSIIRHNLFRMMPNGIESEGKSFAVNIGATGLVYEWAGFGGSSNVLIQNNVLMDLGSTEYTTSYGGTILFNNSTVGYTVDHNTWLDSRIGLILNSVPSTSAPDAQTVGFTGSSNVATPYRSACPGGGCNNPAATSEIGVQNNPGSGALFPYASTDGANSWATLITNGDIDNTSSIQNNILMNRFGFGFSTAIPASYPVGTYLVPDTSGAAADPNVLFTTWQERNNAVPPNGIIYRMGDYHLASGQSALYPAADPRVIGADPDEITEWIGGVQQSSTTYLGSPVVSGQLNGMTGITNELGLPPFKQQVGSRINIGTTDVVLSYLSDGYPCTIQLWPNTSYSGTPTINTTDAGASILNGVVTVSLNGFSATTYYQGKRLCGPSGLATEAEIYKFTTATPSQTVQFTPPAGVTTCEIQYGATTALGSTGTPVTVSGGACVLTIPSTAYWRQAYLISGILSAVGDIQHTIQ